MSLLGNIWVKLGLKSDDFQRGMDSAERKTKTFGETVRGITAKVTALVAAFRMLAGSVKTITNFEAATSKLAAVLGTTVDKMGRMTDSAIELGRRTQYTATQVTELQTELAKLGFAEPEILSMQESVLKFAAAVGTDLGSAAARAGATMRGFGLTAEQTGEMLEVMAVSTSKSALSFGYLDSTLGKLVPVARAFGLDTNATITLLGTLANAGIDASSAGTSLRNIFIQLSDSSSKLNQTIGKQPKTMEELIDAFQTLRDKHVGLEQAQALVDKRSASVLLALMDNADACRDLYGELGNANGALDEMYETMTHNVRGAVEEVKSAWEGFVLSLRGSTGILYTVLTNVRDLIGELNYALFQSTKESTATADAYDRMKRTIAETADPVAALDIAYKRMLATAQEKVSDLENKSALGRLLNHDSLEEAKAQVVGITAAYQQLRGEMTRPTKTVTPATPQVVDDPFGGLLDALSKDKTKEAKDGLSELTAEARAYAAELAEINAYDDEMAATGSALLESWQKEHEAIDEVTQSLVVMNNQTLASLDGMEQLRDKVTEISKDIADSLRRGAIDALGELAEAIGTGNWDTTAMIRALVSPLADAAITIGTIVMTSGQAIDSLQKALKFEENPYLAVAVGAGLIAVGVAAKAGLAALANKGSGNTASGGGNPYTYTGGYGVTPDMLSSAGPMEIEGTVTVKGQDIQIALDNYNANKRR